MEIVVEVISRSERHIHRREKIAQDSVRIGRAFDNDIILDDPYVDAFHGIIYNTEQGIAYRDLDSLNGSHVKKGTQNGTVQQPVLLTPDYVLQLGKTYLRIYPSNHTVAPTRKYQPFDLLQHTLDSPLAAALSIVLFALVGFGLVYLESADLKWPWLVAMWTFAVGSAMVWPLFFFTLGRLFKHEAKLSPQVSISYLFFLAFTLFELLIAKIIAFNMQDNLTIFVVYLVITSVLNFFLLWLNLKFAFQQSFFRRTAISLSITLAFFGLMLIMETQMRDELIQAPSYNGVLLPNQYRLVPTHSASETLLGFAKTFTQADGKVERE